MLRGAVHKDLLKNEYFDKVEKLVTSTPDLRKEVAKMEQRMKEWSERAKAAKA